MQPESDTPEVKSDVPTPLKTTTTVPLERREIVIRPPRGWVRITIAAVEVAFMSWALPVACALVAFLLTASNPWMMEVDWNAAIGVGADVWALSYLSPLTLNGVGIDLVPLGLTILHFGLARIGLWRAKAESWRTAGFFVPIYVVTVAALAALSHTHSSFGWTTLGALIIVVLAWCSAITMWDTRPSWWDQIALYRRSVIDGVKLTGVIAVLGLVSLVVGIVSGWSRVLSIQELVNASWADLILLWIAQLAYLPNVIAAAVSWLAGPGFYAGIDAIHTPSSSPVEPIPSVPVLGAIPHTVIGIWIVIIPVIVGILVSVYFIRTRKEKLLVDHLTHAAVSLAVATVVTTVWMWLSTGGVWSARMSLLGPRWALAGVLVALEVGGTALVIYTLSHPDVLVRLGMREPSGNRASESDEDGADGSVIEEVEGSVIEEVEGSAVETDEEVASNEDSPIEAVSDDSATKTEDETIQPAHTLHKPSEEDSPEEHDTDLDPDHHSPTEDGDEHH
ncbi:MAG: DUF6350 family protein [Actinomycetaceae bacterium]|nr:DUF6350 family protein [Actinomycetaceae bacterium]